MDCSLSGSSVNGISQPRIWEWVAISSSRGPAQSRNQNPHRCVTCTGGQSLYHWVTWGALNMRDINWNPRLRNHDSKDTNLLFVNWKVWGGGGSGLCLLWLLVQQAISEAWTEPQYTWGPDVPLSPKKTSTGAAHPEFLKWERRWVILSQGLRQPVKQEGKGKVGAGGGQTAEHCASPRAGLYSSWLLWPSRLTIPGIRSARGRDFCTRHKSPENLTPRLSFCCNYSCHTSLERREAHIILLWNFLKLEYSWFTMSC